MQWTLDKVTAWHELHFDVIFIGDDWKDTPRWNRYEEELSPLGVTIEFLPYTVTTSSTKLRDALDLLLEGPTA